MPKSPTLYNIPGYLNRKHMSDRIILNYRIFLSLFKLGQQKLTSLNVALNPTTTIRLALWKCHRFVAIRPEGVPNDGTKYNNIYIDDEELSILMQELSRGYGIPSQRDEAERARIASGDKRGSIISTLDQRHNANERRSSIVAPIAFKKMSEEKSSKKITAEMAVKILNSVVLLRASDTLRTGVLVIPTIAKL